MFEIINKNLISLGLLLTEISVKYVINMNKVQRLYLKNKKDLSGKARLLTLILK